MSNTNSYSVEVQWGGIQAPWHEDGTWVIGGRDNQSAVALDAASADDGASFAGTMTYAGEGPVGFRAQNDGGNNYNTWVQWGGNGQPWHPNGAFTLGGRADQRVVEVAVSSADGGITLSGHTTYLGEGPISFGGSQETGDINFNTYQTEVQWGGAKEPWHPNGAFVIGGRALQHAVELSAESIDGGAALVGQMQYAGEGPIGFKATLVAPNRYTTMVQWGGSTAPWHQNGVFVIGGRDGQNVVGIAVASQDGGITLSGEMTYAGEGPISLRATNTP